MQILLIMGLAFLYLAATASKKKKDEEKAAAERRRCEFEAAHAAESSRQAARPYKPAPAVGEIERWPESRPVPASGDIAGSITFQSSEGIPPTFSSVYRSYEGMSTEGKAADTYKSKPDAEKTFRKTARPAETKPKKVQSLGIRAGRFSKSSIIDGIIFSEIINRPKRGIYGQRIR